MTPDVRKRLAQAIRGTLGSVFPEGTQFVLVVWPSLEAPPVVLAQVRAELELACITGAITALCHEGRQCLPPLAQVALDAASKGEGGVAFQDPNGVDRPAPAHVFRQNPEGPQ